MYSLIRGAYRWSNQAVFRHLPDAWRARAHAVMFKLGRRLFPDRIAARSAGEFAGSTANRQAARGRLPEWARREVEALVAFEPLLSPLLVDGAPVEHYVIPWDMNYVGQRYALARRQLGSAYACMLFAGGEVVPADAARWAGLGRPLAVIDVDAAPATEQLARQAGADYLALPAGDLDLRDHCAVLARLALQCAPRQLRHYRHPLIDACIERHGRALASVAEVSPWNAAHADG